MKDERILEEVEKTLNSIESLPKLESNPFLYTRLKSRIARESISTGNEKNKLAILKPVGLALILVINIITAIYFFDVNGKTQSSNTLVNSLSQEYKTNQTQLENYNLE
jgi:hypothetical protein